MIAKVRAHHDICRDCGQGFISRSHISPGRCRECGNKYLKMCSEKRSIIPNLETEPEEEYALTDFRTRQLYIGGSDGVER